MGAVLPQYRRNELAEVKTHLVRTAQRLAAAGCDFFVCPDNTAHIALELPGEALPLPGLHIAEIVAETANADGWRCVGLLGTKWTMEGPVYPAAFARHGIGMRTPGQADRVMVDRVIFDELCQGRLTEPARAEYVRVITDLKHAGCDAVALSCTEIPLLVTPDVSPLPVLDSTRLLAQRAIAVAVEERPLTWRGGPLPAPSGAGVGS
jgi:aspartate racemase